MSTFSVSGSGQQHPDLQAGGRAMTPRKPPTRATIPDWKRRCAVYKNYLMFANLRLYQAARQEIAHNEQRCEALPARKEPAA